MAATEPPPAESRADDQTSPGTVRSGDEPLSADLAVRPPRLSNRVLVAVVLVLVVLLVLSVVVGFVILHQPHLSPVPVPSVPSIA